MKNKILFTLAIFAFLSSSLTIQAQSLLLRENPKMPPMELPLNEFNINYKKYIGKNEVVNFSEFVKGTIFFNDKMNLVFKNPVFKNNKFSSAYGMHGGILSVNGANSKAGFLNAEFENNAAISSSIDDVESKGAYGGVLFLSDGADVALRVRLAKHLYYIGNYVEENGKKKNENGGFAYIDDGSNVENKSMHKLVFYIDTNSNLTIGDKLLPDCDSIASKNDYARLSKAGTGDLTINSSLEHFLGTFQVREGNFVLNNKLGASKISIGAPEVKSTFSLRIEGEHSLSNKNLNNITIYKDSSLRLIIDEDIFNMTKLNYALSAKEDYLLENNGKILSYGAKLNGNTLALNAIQTLALGLDNIVNVSPYDRILVKDLNNEKKAHISFSDFKGDAKSFSVSEIDEESFESLKATVIYSLGSKNLKIQALNFNLQSQLEEGETALISIYIGNHSLYTSKFMIYSKNDTKDSWKLINPKNFSFNGEYINFEVDKFASYAFAVRENNADSN